MATKSKSMKPAPVMSVSIPGGASFRMSFNSAEGKPIDWAHGLKLVTLAAAGDEWRGTAHYCRVPWELREATRWRPADVQGDVIAEHGYPYGNDAYAEAEFRAAYQLPANALVTVSHPTIGVMSLAEVQAMAAPVKAKAPSPAKILEQIRREIREAIDAETALSRLAALVGLDQSAALAA